MLNCHLLRNFGKKFPTETGVDFSEKDRILTQTLIYYVTGITVLGLSFPIHES